LLQRVCTRISTIKTSGGSVCWCE